MNLSSLNPSISTLPLPQAESIVKEMRRLRRAPPPESAIKSRTKKKVKPKTKKKPPPLDPNNLTPEQQRLINLAIGLNK